MSLQLKIITPERLVFEGSVDAVRLPGLDGDFGVLDNHAPLISGIAIVVVIVVVIVTLVIILEQC